MVTKNNKRLLKSFGRLALQAAFLTIVGDFVDLPFEDFDDGDIFSDDASLDGDTETFTHEEYIKHQVKFTQS